MILSLDTSDASKLMEQFSQLQMMFRRQETGGKPIVAAINGTALGRRLRDLPRHPLPHRRGQPKSKVGQPEVKIGLLPGGAAARSAFRA